VLLIVGAVVALFGVGIIARRRMEAERTLGWMSEQWLLQHRASQTQ